MTMIVNVSKSTRHIGGKTLAPGEMADVNMPSGKLEDHLFVRCGDIEVSGRQVSVQASPQGDKKSAAEVIAEIAEMTNLDDLQAAMDDKRKTVSEAAEKRIAELDESGDAGDSSDNGDNQ